MSQDPKSSGSRLMMPAGEYLRQGFASLKWPTILLYGIGAGLLMPISLLQSSVLAVVAKWLHQPTISASLGTYS